MGSEAVDKIKKKLAKRATQLALPLNQQRVEETAEMVLDLKSRQEIVKYLCDTYGLKKRSCDLIITKAYEFIRNNYPTDKESIVVKHINFYYKIATKWQDMDPKASISAMEKVEKLLGLHKDTPMVQINTQNNNYELITTEELKKQVEALKNKSDA